jgi:hypothetical protein
MYIKRGLVYGGMIYVYEYLRRYLLGKRMDWEDYYDYIREFRRIDLLSTEEFYRHPQNVQFLLTNLYNGEKPPADYNMDTKSA